MNNRNSVALDNRNSVALDNRNFIAWALPTSPLGQRLRWLTKTLAESERRQLHPLSPEGKGAWGKRWSLP